MTNNKLEKGVIIDNKYEISFHIYSTDLFDKYRVKDNEGNIYLLDLFNLAKQPKDSFNNGNPILETEILKLLSHKNISKVIEVRNCIIGNYKYFYIVTHNISGETISEKIRREGPLSQYAVIPLISELSDAIQYIHSSSNPIIHNNITPHTVWIDYSENKEKIILSGFEFATNFSITNISNEYLKSNPFYKATELFNGINIPQNDIYSLGALLYFMLTGLHPWHFKITANIEFENLREIIFNNRKKKLSFPKSDNIYIEDNVKETLMKSLSDDINIRFKSATEFKKDLEKEVAFNIEEKENLPREVKDSKMKGGFDDIAGMEELKSVLYNDVIRAIKEKELFNSYGITIPNGMLLYGPPGCGKTFIAEKFSEEIGFRFAFIHPSDLGSIYVHGGQEKIKDLFEEAEKNSPTILCFDEFDALVPKRSENLHQGVGSEVNEFLSRMTNCGEKGIFIIASSNYPELIDPAILRAGRIDKKIYVPPPDFIAREKIFKLYLSNRPIDLMIDYRKLADLTDFYVSSDIKFLVDESSRIAIRKKSRITMEILEEVIRNNNPSVSKNILEKYLLVKNTFNTKSDDKIDKTKDRKFGFEIPKDN